jgi:hypothetical protein
MSATVKLSSALPGDFETNGVDAQAGKLVDDPDQLRCAVIWYDTQKVTHDIDADAYVPTIRVRRIEPIGDVGEVSAAVQQLVAGAHEQRTGRKPLPFDLVEVEDQTNNDPDALIP